MEEIDKILEELREELPLVLHDAPVNATRRKIVQGKSVIMPKYRTDHFSLTAYYKFVVKFPYE